MPKRVPFWCDEGRSEFRFGVMNCEKECSGYIPSRNYDRKTERDPLTPLAFCPTAGNRAKSRRRNVGENDGLQAALSLVLTLTF